jgi:1,4-dihydroxy-2-naphthoyl-CoA hydrolase
MSTSSSQKSIWLHTPSLLDLNNRGKDTLAEHLGIIFTEIGPDFMCATLPVDERTKQPLGILNGGASCALAETLASTAANHAVDQNVSYCVGLDLNANHLRPVSKGIVRAITRPIHLGKRTQVWSIDIFESGGKQICVARMTMAILARQM